MSYSEPLEGNYFISAYPPFSCWETEQLPEAVRVLHARDSTARETPLGLYVHIPFCLERCQYCYYLSYSDKTGDEIDRYLNGLLTEWSLYSKLPALEDRHLDFAYFGGGTPSLLSADRIRQLFTGLQTSLSWSSVREVTFECAPQTVTESKLRALKEGGVTRVSMGVQQLNDEVLQKSGRVHLVRDVERAYALIRQFEFDFVNIDLIVGLVGQTDESFLRSLDDVIDMAPEGITIYQLEVPLNTPLCHALRDGTEQQIPASWDEKRARLNAGLQRMEQAGYTIRSAYSAARDQTHADFVYQDAQYHGADLVGLGVASFSYFAGVHYQNLPDFDSYLEHLQSGTLPLGRAYALDETERALREFVLQLKLGRVENRYFRDKFNIDITQAFAEPLARFAAAHWLTCDDRTVTVTREGLLRIDRLIPEFYLTQHENIRYS